MYELLRQIVLVALVVLWFGGMLLLGLRYRAKRRAYLQRFPPVEGVSLDMYVPLGGSLRVQSAIYRTLLWQRQADHDVERLRRDVWRRLLSLALWAFGGLIILTIVSPSLIFTGTAP